MIILDTHIIVWDALQPEKISKKARKIIDRANDSGEIIIADISLWEIAMLMKKKRLNVDATYPEFIRLIRAANHYAVQPITPEIADLSVSFSQEVNLDPADRLICATSLFLNISLITADSNLIKAKSVETIW
ncbi:MAG: type II toxin-antitoxin system VapC family toxin [Candidatus Marinimicrobia bacterium]|nr:type II toxin-antitoxin system VapC family toxin [Candidatus Neomarinimicrobiota bacterium]